MKLFGEWGIVYMKTNNKQFIQIHSIFIMIGIMFFTCFFFLNQYYQKETNIKVNNAVALFVDEHPEMKQEIASAFEQGGFDTQARNVIAITFDYQYLYYLAFGSIVILGCYAYMYYNTKKQLVMTRQLVNYVDQDQSFAKPLEGDLAILHDKLIKYRRSNENYKALLLKEKEKLASYIEDIAHQVKTPLTSIKVNEELMALENNNEMLKTNALQIQRIEYLLESLLTLARFDNHKVIFDKVETSLASVVEASLHQLQPMIEKKNINIEKNHLDIYAFIDESWMQEAITNIIKNCIGASKSKICIEGIQYEQFIKLRIQDDGNGIDKEDIAHLFTRFYRSKHNKEKGVGIGLALAKEIVEGHQGFIEVHNEQGAVFEITLPIYDLK